jgi:hypothetical protein
MKEANREPSRVPSAERFDEAFTRIAEAPRTNALFEELLGPFPAHVEPFSMVPREAWARPYRTAARE